MLKRIIFVGLLAVSALTMRSAPVNAAGSPLQGAWQVTNPAGGSGMAGIFIFSGTYYSMMAASTERPDITDLSKASVDEMRALYGPMVGNAGAYEIAGNMVTIRPVVAKIPVVMKSGAYEVYEFKIENNTLTLSQRRNTRGPVERGTVWTLSRVE